MIDEIKTINEYVIVFSTSKNIFGFKQCGSFRSKAIEEMIKDFDNCIKYIEESGEVITKRVMDSKTSNPSATICTENNTYFWHIIDIIIDVPLNDCE